MTSSPPVPRDPRTPQTSAPAPAPDSGAVPDWAVPGWVGGDCASLAGRLTEVRHALHRRPEIGLDLPRTQRLVLDELAGLPLQVSRGTSCSSVTAVLRGAAAPSTPGRRTVLLRADMDALPVTEELDLPYRSEVDGAMHACGHDLHTAMLLGAARVLAERREELPGDVVFMFQPGEEGFDGAGHMIKEGVLDAAGRRPDAAYALHVMAHLGERGTVMSRPGPLLAASDAVRVVVRGRGGHASAPHVCLDPIPAACEMVLALQTAITRSVDAFAPVVLTVGMIHAGTKRNIVPDEAVFEATVRSFDPAVSALVEQAVRRTCAGVAAAHGVSAEVEYTAEYPVTVNDPAAVEGALGLAGELFGAERITRMPDPIAGAEDFSRVIAQVPGAMLFVGAAPPAAAAAAADGGLAANHSPRAAFDDAVLPDGAALYTALALHALSAESR